MLEAGIFLEPWAGLVDLVKVVGWGAISIACYLLQWLVELTVRFHEIESHFAEVGTEELRIYCKFPSKIW